MFDAPPCSVIRLNLSNNAENTSDITSKITSEITSSAENDPVFCNHPHWPDNEIWKSFWWDVRNNATLIPSVLIRVFDNDVFDNEMKTICDEAQCLLTQYESQKTTLLDSNSHSNPNLDSNLNSDIDLDLREILLIILAIVYQESDISESNLHSHSLCELSIKGQKLEAFLAHRLFAHGVRFCDLAPVVIDAVHESDDCEFETVSGCPQHFEWRQILHERLANV